MTLSRPDTQTARDLLARKRWAYDNLPGAVTAGIAPAPHGPWPLDHREYDRYRSVMSSPIDGSRPDETPIDATSSDVSSGADELQSPASSSLPGVQVSREGESSSRSGVDQSGDGISGSRCRTPYLCPDCERPISLNPSGWWSHDGMPNGCWRLSMDGPGDRPLTIMRACPRCGMLTEADTDGEPQTCEGCDPARPLDFTGRMHVGDHHEQEIADDPWQALYYEPGDRADDVGPAIAARTIAGWCHGGQASALYSFASSGHLDRDACVRELDAMQPEPPECAVELASFLRGLDVSTAPVAYKYADPTGDERFIYDEDEAQEIVSVDPSLIVRPSSPRWNLVTRTLRAKEGLS